MIDPELLKIVPVGKTFRLTGSLAENGRISHIAAMAAVELDWMLQETRGIVKPHFARQKIDELSLLLKEVIGADDPNMSPLCSDPFGLHVLVSVLGEIDPPLAVTAAPEVVGHIATFAKQLAVTVSTDAQNADVALLRRLMEFCISFSGHSRRTYDAFRSRYYDRCSDHRDRNRW